MRLAGGGVPAKSVDRLARGSGGVGERKNLRREIARVVDRAQRGDDRGDVSLTESDRAAIRVGEVDVPDEGTRLAQGGGGVGLLDVHVKEIGEKAHVFRAGRVDGAQPRGGVAEAVEEIRLVAIERLHEHCLDRQGHRY